MDLHNLAYALTQVIHNFGAVAVVGGALLGIWPKKTSAEVRRKLAWLILFGWVVQAGSGAGFGSFSYAFYGQFPDLSTIALTALVIKVACALTGIVTGILFLRFQYAWTEDRQQKAWVLTLILGITALTAAAFLRWFA